MDAPVDSVDAGHDAEGGADRPPACSTSGTGATSLGQPCSCGSDCGSGFCVEGVCCKSACTGKCMSCSRPGSEGTCDAVPAGASPRTASECPIAAASTCGEDGTCDGSGGCRKFVNGTVCASGACAGSGITGMRICDGEGSCRIGPTVSCAPYICGTANNQCLNRCNADSDCSPGHNCIAGSCGKLPNGGGPCTQGSDCKSGFCADGVCCNVACDSACVSCKQTGFEGQCQPLGSGIADSRCPAEAKPTCGTTGVCDGLGACAKAPVNTSCTSPSCTGNTAMTAGSCDGQGTCRPPGQLDCTPYRCSTQSCKTTCTLDSDCVPPNSCIGGSCGQKPLGSSCTAAAQCQSKQCVDGVCCDSACGGACQSCALQIALGHCTSVGNGAGDPHGICQDKGAASCGTDGKCDGAGACRRYPPDTVCASESCAGGAYTPPSTCNASGQCIPPASQTCFPYTCNGNKCFTSCTQTAGQCGGTNSCLNGSCGLKPPGASCSSADECQPAPDGKGYCAQGVCCNAACTSACQACNQSGSLGTCSAVAQNAPDPQGKCATTATASCGTNGKCRNGACDVYHTTDQCKPAACSNTSTALLASFCAGTGAACPAPATMSCGVYTCNAATGACNSACKTNADCVSPNTCINNSCGLKPNGAACAAAAECVSGNCTEGVCCNTTCSDATGGTCLSCKVTGKVGTCSPVAAGGADPKSRCVAAAQQSCGLDGTCDGTGKCRYWATTTGCRSQSCTGSTQINTASCDGKGACPASTTKACDPYACNVSASTCRTTCTSNTDCNTGVTCNTQTNKCGDKLPTGKVCALNSDCTSGFCVENLATDSTGICCNSACTGGCQSCALANSLGSCTNMPAAATPRDASCPVTSNACGNTGKCNGAGGCQIQSGGTACGVEACPAGTTTFTGFGSCDGNGTCTPASATMCVGYLCDATKVSCKTSCTAASDCDTANGYTCSSGICQKLANGGACTASNQCNSGACRDSVCCATSNCTSMACFTCNGTSPGTCTPVAANAADPHASTDGAACTAAAATTCGNTGVCDGSGACQKYSSSTVCRAAACASSSSMIAPASCPGGGGACPAMVTTACSPGYLCSGTACATSCTSANAATTCDGANGYVCSGGNCLKANGKTCAADADCASGACVSTNTGAKICCGSSCPADTSSAGCGNTGACDSASFTCAQAAAGKVCSSPACSTNRTQATSAGSCSGAGSCNAGLTTACTPGYLCTLASGTCPSSCASDADCDGASSYVCVNGQCLTPKANGQACGTANASNSGADCVSGHCVAASGPAGICCASACPAGACTTNACLGDGSACAPVAAGTTCGPGACSPDLTSGTNQTCDGAGACTTQSIACPAGTACVSGTPVSCQ